MKPYLIYFWHGCPPANSDFMRKVEAICRKRPKDDVFQWDTYYWDGTIDEFADKWQDRFVYVPPNSDPSLKGILCITPFPGFGQR